MADYCFVFLVLVPTNVNITLQKEEIAEFVKIPAANAVDHKASMTPFTFDMLNYLFCSTPLPVPLLRGGKVVASLMPGIVKIE